MGVQETFMKELKRRFFRVVVENDAALDFRRARLKRLVGFYFLQDRISLFILEQNLDTALGRVQSFLTLARKPHAVFKKFKTFFQRQIAVFELADDFFELAER